MSTDVKINREDFIHTLEQVTPGLSSREIVQQSSCFVFNKGRIATFNEEVACRAPSKLPKEFRGAVQAKPLMDILRKLPDEKITIQSSKNKMVILGKNRRTRVVMENAITLPINTVDVPENWRKIHKDFTDAIGIVQECASKDQSAFTFTCIHVHPHFMEACDNLQLTRYKLKTGVSKSYLVRRDSLKHVPTFDFRKMSETATWVHFKTENGLVMSCRRYLEKFEDLGHLLNDKGTPTILPKALGEAADRCETFSQENTDENMVTVVLRQGRLQIVGLGASGDHAENKRLKYSGPNMTFRIAPKMLMELLKRHTDCQISKKHRLTVDGGKFRYVVCLEKGTK